MRENRLAALVIVLALCTIVACVVMTLPRTPAGADNETMPSGATWAVSCPGGNLSATTTTSTEVSLSCGAVPPSPIEQVGKATDFSSLSSTAPSTATPVGVTAGDVLVSYIETYSLASVTCGPGWRQLFDAVDGFIDQLVACTAVAEGTGPAPNASVAPAAQVSMVTVAYSGVDPTNPIDATSSASGPVSPALTIDSPGARLVFGEGSDAGTVAAQAPAGALLGDTVNNANLSQVAVATSAVEGAGTVPDTTWTLPPSAADSGAVALRPIAAGATSTSGSATIGTSLTLAVGSSQTVGCQGFSLIADSTSPTASTLSCLGDVISPVPPAPPAPPASPPAQICGNAAVLQGPSSPPPGFISVPAGIDSATNLDQSANFWFAPGVHEIDGVISPASGSTYEGGYSPQAGAATIDGMGLATRAFEGNGANVTVEYLTIEDFVPEQGEAAVNHDAGAEWTIADDTVQDIGGGQAGTAGVAVDLGTANTLSDNCITNNAQTGFEAFSPTAGDTGLTIDHNEVSFNGSAAQNGVCGCDTGGRLLFTVDSSITNNYVHDNGATGIWADANDAGLTITGNYISGNANNAIAYEDSYNALIEDNTLIDNGWVVGPAGADFPEGAVYISGSGGDPRLVTEGVQGGSPITTLTVWGNALYDNWGGIVEWEDANLYCGSEGQTICPLGAEAGQSTAPASLQVGGQSCGETSGCAGAGFSADTCSPSALGAESFAPNPSDEGTYSADNLFWNCRYRTQNVVVSDNTLDVTPAEITPSAYGGLALCGAGTAANTSYQGGLTNTTSETVAPGDAIASSSTVTSITVAATGSVTGYGVGTLVTLANPATGQTQNFIVSGPFSSGPTSTVPVVPTLATFNFPAGSYVAIAGTQCGTSGIFSEWGASVSGNSPAYNGNVIEQAVAFHQGNSFSSNTWCGAWSWEYPEANESADVTTSFPAWQGVTGYRFDGTSFTQDAGSSDSASGCASGPTINTPTATTTSGSTTTTTAATTTTMATPGSGDGTGAPTTPPAVICGTAILDNPSTSPPPNAVVVPASLLPVDPSTLEAPGKVYWFAAGDHFVSGKISPGNNSVYEGATGAVLDGALAGPTSAFGGEASGVTIGYLTIQSYSLGAGTSAENDDAVNDDLGQNWVIQNNTIRWNGKESIVVAGVVVTPGGGYAVGLTTGDVLQNDCLTGNAQGGFNAGRPNGAAGNFGNDIIITHNEMSDAGIIDGSANANGIYLNNYCGCSAGGGKFFFLESSIITDNYVHDNAGVPGIWGDTNNAGVRISGNYIANNGDSGIIYEASYNALITDNTITDNGWARGAQNIAQGGGSFPEAGGVYVADSGGDSRIAGGTQGISTVTVSGNSFVDNWGGVVVWNDANRFCGPTGGGDGNVCTLGPNASETACAKPGYVFSPDPSNQSTYSPSYSTAAGRYWDCRYTAKNVLVTGNSFTLDPAKIPLCQAGKAGNTMYPGEPGFVAGDGGECGFVSLVSEYAAGSTCTPTSSTCTGNPYVGTDIETAVAFHEHNVFADNSYVGPWSFQAPEVGDSTLTFAQWRAAPYSQDAGSSATS